MAKRDGENNRCTFCRWAGYAVSIFVAFVFLNARMPVSPGIGDALMAVLVLLAVFFVAAYVLNIICRSLFGTLMPEVSDASDDGGK